MNMCKLQPLASELILVHMCDPAILPLGTFLVDLTLKHVLLLHRELLALPASSALGVGVGDEVGNMLFGL